MASKQHQIAFDTFINDPEPHDIARELAQSRVLFLQFQESIVANKEEQRDAFLQLAKETLEEQMRGTDIDPAMVEWVSTTSDEVYRNIYNAVFVPMARLTVKEAEVLSKILKTTSDIADKFRKIQDGVTVKLDFNERMTQAMMQFIVRIVLPHVPLEKRAALAFQAQQFLPALKGERVVIDATDV